MKCVAQPYKMEVLKDWVGLDVGGMEVCDIPIGEDDTGGSPVWVFYRNRLFCLFCSVSWTDNRINSKLFYENLRMYGSAI